MNVLLIKPPENSRFNFGCFSLSVLAAPVRDYCDVQILDATERTVSQSVEEAQKFKPDLIGITTMSWESVQAVALLIKALRGDGFKGMILAGGHGATGLPVPILKAGADAVVLGEGEITLIDIVRNGLSETTPGIAFLKEGVVSFSTQRPLIKSLDGLALPPYDLMATHSEGSYFLETSRGCPHRCFFCEASLFYRHTWRGKSPAAVVEDVQRLVEDRNAVIIHVVDDNFTADPIRAYEICRLLKGKARPLFFLFSARSDDLVRLPELIPALAESGFLRVNVGIETTDNELAKAIGKPVGFETHKRALAMMQEEGIFNLASFIVGLPGETQEMRDSYFEKALELAADSVQFLPYIPLPKTALDESYKGPEDWSRTEADEMTRRYRTHPDVNSRLLSGAREKSVRGALIRGLLKQRQQLEGLDESVKTRISKTLAEINGFESSESVS